jgi:hypothetical protein
MSDNQVHHSLHFVLKSSLLQDEADRSDFHGQSRLHEMQSGCSKHVGGYFFTFVTMVGAKTTAASQF